MDRSNHDRAMKTMSVGEKSLREFPRSVLVFPEGTRSRDGKMKDFKKGAFVLAIQVPVRANRDTAPLQPSSTCTAAAPTTVYSVRALVLKPHSLTLNHPQTGLPVVPIAVIGTGDVMRADQMSIDHSKAEVRLEIGTPISTRGLTYKDRDMLCAKVQREVKRLRDKGRKELGLDKLLPRC